MAIRTATGPNGEKLTFRSATNEAGETQWFQVPAPQQSEQPEFKPDIRPEIKAPETLPYGMSQSDINSANKRIQAHNQYENSFIGDKERQKLKAEEAERGFLSGVGEGIKHVGKEFYAGTLQSPDWLPESLQSVLDYKLGGDNSKTREEDAADIAAYMDAENNRYDITRGENPFSTTVGEAIPFLATGAVGERALLNIGGKLNPLAKEVSIGLNKRLGNTVEADRLANLPKRFNSELIDTSNAVARGAITGGAEGAAQYDSSAGEGALVAGLGGAMSNVGILSPLKKVRNERDAGGKKIIDEMYENGFQITPGIRSGNRALQTEEAGMRNSDMFSQDFYNLVDRPNERRITDMAGEAIGMNLKDRDIITQTELADHMANLRNQYQELEANTVGKITLDSRRKIGQILKNAQPVRNRNQSIPAKQHYAILVDASNEINTVLQPFTTQSGKFARQQFDGSKYQAATQYLNDKISKAFNDGDKILARNLKSIKSELDKSIESGMGKADAKQWRDLNERYAMTRMLMENGMTPSGRIDPRKITSAVMSNDEAVRTLTGSGGRIRKFQDIARYNDVLDGRDVQGGSLTGLGSPDYTANRSGFTRAIDRIVPPMKALELGYKTNQLRYPFVGKYISPIHGLTTPQLTNLGRSIAQTETPADLVTSAAEDVQSGYEGIKRLLGFQ